MSISTIKKRQEAVHFLFDNNHIADELITQLLIGPDGKKLPDIPTLLQKIKVISKEGLPADHPASRANIYNIEQYAKHNVKQFCLILDLFDYLYNNFTKIKKAEWFDADQNLPVLLKQILTEMIPDLSKEIRFWSKAFDRKQAKEIGKIVPEAGSVPAYDQSLEEIEKCKDELDKARDELAEELGISKPAKNIPYVSKPKHPYLFKIDAKYESRILNNNWKIHASIKATKKEPKKLLIVHDNLQIPFAKQLAQAEEKSQEILRDKVTTELYIQWIQSATKWLEMTKGLEILDALISLAAYANSESDIDMCQPEFVDPKNSDETHLSIVKSKHPCITLPKGQKFIKNDIFMTEKKLMLLTGPNMGGKTTIMRQTALSIILAQIGSLVPAKSCKLSVFDRIFTRIGGADNLSKGESTFYIELNETSSILHNATKNSFIIIDELGRGTSTYDGTAIAYAVYQRLTEISALSIVSTHYHKMIENIKENSEIIGKMQLKFMQCHEERDPERENKIINVTCLYKLADGICPQSHGFACAERADIEDRIIDTARQFAFKMSESFEALEKSIKLVNH